MSWLRRLFSDSNKTEEQHSGKELKAIPTVVFDPALVTETVKSDLRKNVQSLGLPKKHVEAIYQAALRSVSVGRDLHLLSKALMEIAGMTRGQAGQVALSLNDKATAMIEQERRGSLGITHAIWMYAAPCMNDPHNPSESDVQRDAAHRAANGKKYEISKGMYLNGKWTRPRVEDGCKCVSRSVMPWS